MSAQYSSSVRRADHEHSHQEDGVVAEGEDHGAQDLWQDCQWNVENCG